MFFFIPSNKLGRVIYTTVTPPKFLEDTLFRSNAAISIEGTLRFRVLKYLSLRSLLLHLPLHLLFVSQ
jgi:hypothetical protein